MAGVGVGFTRKAIGLMKNDNVLNHFEPFQWKI
jgi:hypothetical protein